MRSPESKLGEEVIRLGAELKRAEAEVVRLTEVAERRRAMLLQAAEVMGLVRNDLGIERLALKMSEALRTAPPVRDEPDDHHADQLARLGEHVEASRPEPPPVPCGEEVAPVLLEWLGSSHRTSHVVRLVRQRDAYGRKKYGQGLCTHDGRDGVEDLHQGLGDALLYACKVVLADGRDHELRAVAGVLNVLHYVVNWPEAMRDELRR